MALTTEIILDRQRLKKRLNRWRLASLFLIAIGSIAIGNQFGLFSEQLNIAKLNITGLITDDIDRNLVLSEIEKNSSIQALIVNIDSPGGTFVGGEALFEQLRKISEKKPVVSLMGGTATSAAYMTAIGADYVIARAGTLTGSIGIILHSADITGLMKNFGIKPEIVKSGALKGQPNPLEPFSKEARSSALLVINDFFEMFVEIIAERRSLKKETVLSIADGRIFSGRMAQKLGLVDIIGSENDALEWLEREHGIKRSIPVIRIPVPNETNFWSGLADRVLGKNFVAHSLRLDGVLSLWHPGLY